MITQIIKIRNSEAKLFQILFELWLLMVYRITKWRESADIEEIEYSSLTQERKAKLSAFVHDKQMCFIVKDTEVSVLT